MHYSVEGKKGDKEEKLQEVTARNSLSEIFREVWSAGLRTRGKLYSLGQDNLSEMNAIILIWL